MLKKIKFCKMKPTVSLSTVRNFLSILYSCPLNKSLTSYKPDNSNLKTLDLLQSITSGNSRTNQKSIPMPSKISNPSSSAIIPNSQLSLVNKSPSFSVSSPKYQAFLLKNVSWSVNLLLSHQFQSSDFRVKPTLMMNGRKKGPVSSKNFRQAWDNALSSKLLMILSMK